MNPTESIDKYIANLPDWRRKRLAEIREIIHDADSEIVEEWKWMGSPCFYHNGLVVVVNAHKDKIKMTFYQGAHLPDPDKIFNAGLDGNKWRAIDIYQADIININSLKALIKSAVSYNSRKSIGDF